MPRQLNRAACNTCRHRKVKCDENLPICQRCDKAGRYCDRFQIPLRFRSLTSSAKKKDDGGEAPPFPLPELPRKVLETARMADYFQHYISDVARWYDLSDASSVFATEVPRIALDDPLLFSAVMALSAMHVSSTAAAPSGSAAGAARDMAEFYHGCCIHLLIGLDEGDGRLEGGVALAATCLLRSYEILDAQDADPNRHLRGAYSLASFQFQHHQGAMAMTLSRGLLAAGFWNYLREDITFSLFGDCPLKIDLDLLIPPPCGVLSPTDDQDHLNAISLVLGRVINVAFALDDETESNGRISEGSWAALFEMVRAWHAALPLHFAPFSSARVASMMALPSVRVLQDCHASSLHYYLISVMILARHGPSPPIANVRQLKSLPGIIDTDVPEPEEEEDLLEHLALRICGIAFSSNTPAVLVNAFGPMSYASKWIRNPIAREEVARHLLSCKRSTGWPVHRIVTNLRSSWANAVDQGI